MRQLVLAPATRAFPAPTAASNNAPRFWTTPACGDGHHPPSKDIPRKKKKKKTQKTKSLAKYVPGIVDWQHCNNSGSGRPTPPWWNRILRLTAYVHIDLNLPSTAGDLIERTSINGPRLTRKNSPIIRS